MISSGTSDAAITVDATYVGDRAALAADWQRLQAQADHSFFQSWAWIGCWLRHLPEEQRIIQLTARRDGVIVGLGLLGERRERRRGVIVSDAAHLTAVGRDPFDSLVIEHNGILVDRRYASSVRSTCLRWLAAAARDGRWDEVYLPGVDPGYASVVLPPGVAVCTRRLAPSYYVDLAQMRERGIDYIDALSSNSRHQIRRALRLYEKRGPLAVTVASSPEEANQFFDALQELHAALWKARGQETPFTSAFAVAFHRDLIASRLEAGDIQLMRVTAGSDVVGYLYNFAYAGRIYTYQTGLSYQLGSAFRPGYVSNVLAVRYNLQLGQSTYDLLFGEERYKRSLGTHCEQRAWLVLQRQRLDFRIEEGLRRLKRSLSPLRSVFDVCRARLSC